MPNLEHILSENDNSFTKNNILIQFIMVLMIVSCDEIILLFFKKIQIMRKKIAIMKNNLKHKMKYQQHIKIDSLKA